MQNAWHIQLCDGQRRRPDAGLVLNEPEKQAERVAVTGHRLRAKTLLCNPVKKLCRRGPTKASVVMGWASFPASDSRSEPLRPNHLVHLNPRSGRMLLVEPHPAAAGLYRRWIRRTANACLFDDIPSPDQRAKAEELYAELCDHHAERLPSSPRLLPILAGRARDLALRPQAHGSERGRRIVESRTANTFSDSTGNSDGTR